MNREQMSIMDPRDGMVVRRKPPDGHKQENTAEEGIIYITSNIFTWICQ